MELNFYFICPLYITAIIEISKLVCLKNKINTVCCFSKTTHKRESNSLTYTCISGYDIKASWIYWNNNKNAWYPVLLRTYILCKFGTKQNSFRHTCKVFSHDIARYLIVLIYIHWPLENFVLIVTWICPLNYT
jgi:hypothetical protein